MRSEARQLDAGVRGDMERMLGAPFGDIVVHEGPQSAATAEGYDAAAFTVGRHIVFNTGRLDAASPRGRALLAHELTHAMQQRRGGGDPDAGERMPRSALPVHGGASESAAAHGGAGGAGPATGVGVARQTKAEEKAAASTPQTVPMFEYTDEAGVVHRVTPEEADRLRADAVKRMRAALTRVESTAQIWRSTHKEHLDMGHAESWGELWDKPSRIFGVASNIRAGVVPPTLGIWHGPISRVAQAREAIDAGNLKEAARLLRIASTQLTDAKTEWNTFLEASIGGAEKLAGELEVVRDTSFAIAIAAGGIVAAPVVGAVVGGTGLTATALTAVGTGVVTTAGGAALRGGADALGQVSAKGKVDWKQTGGEVRKHLKDDFLAGAGGGAAKGASQAVGLGQKGLSLSQTVGRSMVAQGATTAATGTVATVADTGLALAEGKSWDKAVDENFVGGMKATGMSTVSSVASAPFGGLGQAVGKNNPMVGKAVEYGGGAVVAGGTTLAQGGTWDEARQSALTSVVTSALVAKGQAGTEAKSEAKTQAKANTKPVAPTSLAPDAEPPAPTKTQVKEAAAPAPAAAVADAAVEAPHAIGPKPATPKADAPEVAPASAPADQAPAPNPRLKKAREKADSARKWAEKTDTWASDAKKAASASDTRAEKARISAEKAAKKSATATQKADADGATDTARARAESAKQRAEKSAARAEKTKALADAAKKKSETASGRAARATKRSARADARVEKLSAPPKPKGEKASETARAAWDTAEVRGKHAEKLGARPHEQLHHEIELGVLDIPEFAGAYTPDELNSLSNMKVIPLEVNAADAANLATARSLPPEQWPQAVKDAVEMVPTTGGKDGTGPKEIPLLRERGSEGRPATLHQSEIRKEWNRQYKAIKEALHEAEAQGRLLPGSPERIEFVRDRLEAARKYVDFKYSSFWGQTKREAGL